jgi:hypothetical protein
MVSFSNDVLFGDESTDPSGVVYYGEVEHGPACRSCAETMICVADDSEVEIKAKYLGNSQYVDEDYTHQSSEDPLIEIFMREDRKSQSD